jgi:hypothetical protein
VIRGLPDWRALVLRGNLNPVVVSIRPAWKRLAYRLGRRVPVYVPRQQDARTLEREPAPAEVAPALSEADLARFFAADSPQDTRVPGPFPLPSGPDPRTFKPGKPAS